MGLEDSEIAAERLVVGVVALGDDAVTIGPERIGARQRELISRVESEPRVAAVAFSSGVPGFAPGRLLRFDNASTAVRHPGAELGVDALDVGLTLFEAYDATILAGRHLTAADRSANRVVVNRAFVQDFLDPAASPDTALGVRFRYVAPYERPGTRPETSSEVVGVVRDFPAFPPEPGSSGSPTIYDQQRAFWRYLAWGVGLLTLSVLLLSAAGMYAMMSFTVAQRTREIAIRAALGAAPRRLILSIFGRAIRQLALGIAAGSLLAAAIFQSADVGTGRSVALVAMVGGLMVAVGLLAASGPARRGLRIQPSDALRADG